VKILVVEDDQETRDYIARSLKERGHSAELAGTGPEGLSLAKEGVYDVIVLDRMMPGIDGLSLLKELRGSGLRTPVLFLTSLGSLEDRVQGLEMGGDDYLVKPFAFPELYARLQSLARRPPLAKELETELRCGDLELRLLERSVFRAGKRIELHPTEFRLLEYLMRHSGRVVTRSMLLENVWQFHFDPKTNVVETHISRLRSKIDRGFERELLKTVRGAGYKIDA
jgi:two-component system, OmpR family, response regulator